MPGLHAPYLTILSPPTVPTLVPVIIHCINMDFIFAFHLHNFSPALWTSCVYLLLQTFELSLFLLATSHNFFTLH